MRRRKISLAAVLAGVLAACERGADTGAALPYAAEYPSIGYAESVPAGRLGRFAAAIEARGRADPATDAGSGYLDSVLDALEIDPSSQVLVYSRTSVQVGGIRPATPRAIYFNDDTYVARVSGARTLELAGYDPSLGPVFYRLALDPGVKPAIERQLGSCLRCHDTYGLGGGGVPRFLIGSGYTGTDGELVSHEAWILTTQATPLRNRWGGWYVTGRHGNAVHLGNIVIERPEDLQDLDSLRVGNIDDLGELIDTSGYLRPTSDIVALLVLEHQIEVQNLLSRLRFESARAAREPDALDTHVDALVRAMLMIDAIELSAPIAGSSGFAEHFESLGPFDSRGRSLRQLDLESRLFRHPLSYLIYSDGFAALGPEVSNVVFDHLRSILEATPEQDGFTGLSVSDRASIAAILTETLPAFAAAR